MNANPSSSTQHESLRTLLQQLQAALDAAGLWSVLPPSEQALASTMPFMYDTLRIEQWLQWVFVPRLQALIDGGQPLPGQCSVQPLAEHEWGQRAVPQCTEPLRLLAEIDALLSGTASA